MAYVVLDPFMVLRSYDSFYNTEVGLNKDYISTTIFDRHYQNEHYDSFIFGNSRSMFYQISDWKNHLHGEHKCYHFDASGESLYALAQKVKYIDCKGANIENVLLVIDHSTLIQDQPRGGHMNIISPQLVNYKNLMAFHAEFIKAFMSFKFLYAYFDYKISGQVKPYMTEDNLIGNTESEADVLTNEVRFPSSEALISKGLFYTEEKRKLFFKRDSIPNFSPPAIASNQKILLQEIAGIFKRHKTNCKIIISPLYDQIKLNRSDLDFLKVTFGGGQVFDFSGVNKFTNDYTNYYETSHYRPHVAREIMNIVYGDTLDFVVANNQAVKLN